MQYVTYAILGYGGRGECFAELAKLPEMFSKVVAVAEPDPDKQKRAMKDCQLPADKSFDSAEELLSQPRMADAVINTTMDKLHVSTAIAAMEKGYHQLLEKPMAMTLEDCQAIDQAQRKTGMVVGVCHSLRYHLVYAHIKKMLDAGLVGEVVSFDHIEGVNNIHQSHSFVRGNWAKEENCCFMLMTKSCHDLDLFNYLFKRKCERVSSFGSLTYFTEKNKPEGAPPRCLDGCPAEQECPYHCSKVYLETNFWWFPFPRKDEASVIEYLRTGPYGRCVFQADNDVVDHQVVSLEYEGGLTGTFTMTAFHSGGRFTRIHGTKGTIDADMDGLSIKHKDFITENEEIIKPPLQPEVMAAAIILF